jgi:hypothetical protein
VEEALEEFNRTLEPDLAEDGRWRAQAGYLSGFAGKAGGLALRVAAFTANDTASFTASLRFKWI